MGTRLAFKAGLPHLLGGVRFQMSEQALGAITTEAKASKDGRETGGILLGHDHHSDGLLQVTEAGGPGAKARRSAKRFLRDLDHARTLGDLAYERDGSVWLGEWHTHPKGSPLPSPSDLATYLGLLADDSLGFDSFASIIVTAETDEEWDHPLLWPWVVTSKAVQLCVFRVMGAREEIHG